jgi:acetyl esterase/lipase
VRCLGFQLRPTSSALTCEPGLFLRFLCPFSALLLAGFLSAQTLAATYRDIEYGQAGGESLKLDVHVPGEGEGPFPVAILIHGGGWSGGDKSGSDRPGSGADITPWFEPLTKAKFTWFSINYRLAPQHRWPACFDDVQTAIRWVKAHAVEYCGDPQRIALFGHSAGGHLAFLAAVLADSDTRVHAVVGYAPVTDFEQELPIRGGLSKSLQQLHDRPPEVTPDALELLRATSPITHLSPGAPPFLILHGDQDRTVPLQQSLNFQAQARVTGNLCDMIVLPGAGHRLTDWHTHMPDYADRVVAWLFKHFDAASVAH